MTETFEELRKRVRETCGSCKNYGDMVCWLCDPKNPKYWEPKPKAIKSKELRTKSK